jgi:hypothetical protein
MQRRQAEKPHQAPVVSLFRALCFFRKERAMRYSRVCLSLLVVAMTASQGGISAAERVQATANGNTAAPTSLYSCPMHPQIQWSKPVPCPICGMALKLKKSAQGQPATPAISHGNMPMNHSMHGGMGMMENCPQCMQMMGMGGMGTSHGQPPASAKAVPVAAPMRMSSGRGCGC